MVCHCAPSEACHADALVGLWREHRGEAGAKHQAWKEEDRARGARVL